MALKEFKLPDIGEGIAEGEIVSWKVKEGQQVKEEDEFVEVMTDKATVTITVPYSGVIQSLRCKAGDVVPVGSVIAVIDAGAASGTAGAAPAAAPKPAAAPTPAARPAEKPVALPAQAKPPAVPPAPKPAPVLAAAAPAAPSAFVQSSPGKVLAAPATRRRARELGIDLGQVAATGPRGRITNADLAVFSGAGSGAAAPAARGAAPTAAPAGRAFAPVAIHPAPAGRTEERVPFRGLRRKIAEAMTRSKFTAT